MKGPRALILAVMLALLASAPFLPFISLPWLGVLTMANYYAIFAMSWDILSGTTRKISFGHAFFVAAAGYTSGLLNLYLKWPVTLTIPLGALAALFLGLIVAVPALRLRGPYFAVVTLVLPLVALKFVIILGGFTGAELGKFGLQALPFVPLSPYALNRQFNYYYSLGLLALLSSLLLWLSFSRFGRIFEAIGENEDVVEASGINVAKYKIMAFVIALVAGLGGAFYVHFWRAVMPGTILTLQLSVEIILAAVLGGMGTIIGPIVGAYFVVAGRRYLGTIAEQYKALHFLGEWSTFLFVAILIALLFFARRGLIPALLAPLRRP